MLAQLYETDIRLRPTASFCIILPISKYDFANIGQHKAIAWINGAAENQVEAVYMLRHCH